MFLAVPVEAAILTDTEALSVQTVLVPVSWVLAGGEVFSSEEPGVFTYTAVLNSSNFVLGEGVVLPSVTVEVEDGTLGAASVHSCGIDHSLATELTNESDPVLTSGQYVVAENILDKDFVVPAGESVTLCLNGYTLDGTGTDEQKSVLEVRGTLTLEDCNTSGNGAGKIVDGYGTYTVLDSVPSHYGGGVFVGEGATFILNGGEISGNTAGRCGGGVAVAPGGRFVMNAGLITGNGGEYGAGVYLDREGVFELNNGTIAQNTSGRRGGGVSSLGTFTMNGGDISNNTAPQGGAGVSTAGTFTQNGGNITGNQTVQSGAGLSVVGGSTALLIGGAINGNTATRFGGGMHIEGSTLTLNGTVVGGNTATLGGGGIFAQANATLSMRSGQIYENRSNAFGGGVYLNGASMQMDGGSVNGNVSANNGGGFYLLYGSEVILNDGTVSGNQSEQYGGGFSVGVGNVTVNGGLVSGNTSVRNGGGFSIADGTITMNDGSVVQNSAGENGGGFSVGSLLVMNGGIVEHNTAAQNGGGMYLTGVAGLEGEKQMTGGVIRHNTAQNGGGVYLTNGSLDIHDSILSMSGGNIEQNTASQTAGGIYVGGVLNAQGAATVQGNTVAHEANNVYLTAEQTIQLTGALLGQMGVRTQTEPNPPVAVASPVSYAITLADVENLLSDNEAFFSYLDGADGLAKLTKREIIVEQADTVYGDALPEPNLEISEEGIEEGDVNLLYTGTLRDEQTPYSSALAPENAGAYTLTASYTSGGITQMDTASFAIEPRSLENAAVEITDSLQYNGNLQVQPVDAVRIEDVPGIPAPLQPGQDYEVQDNVQQNAGEFVLHVTANEQGNYTQQADAPFVIEPKAASLVIENATMQQGSVLPAFGWILSTGIEGQLPEATNPEAVRYELLNAEGEVVEEPTEGVYSVGFAVAPTFADGGNYRYDVTLGTLTVTAPPEPTPEPTPTPPSSSSSAPASSGSLAPDSSEGTPTPAPASSSSPAAPAPPEEQAAPSISEIIDPSASLVQPTSSAENAETGSATGSGETSESGGTQPNRPSSPRVNENGSISIPSGTAGNAPQAVYLDGRALAVGEYTIDEETGEVTLAPELFASLENGEHTVRLDYANGEAYESVLITENGVPLSAGAFVPVEIMGVWSLFNVLATCVLLAATLWLFVRRRKQPDEPQNGEETRADKKQMKWRQNPLHMVSAGVSAMAVLLLLFTQDFTRTAVVLDRYSLLYVLLLGVQAAICYAVLSKKKRDETREKDKPA